MARTKSDQLRNRILETADRLFYQEGLRAVGVDRIIAEAQVAKMSLYKYFPSKDDLILAVLEYREEQFSKQFSAWCQEAVAKGQSSFEAFFFALKQWFESSDFRGCMFINSHAELADPDHPSSQYAVEQKKRFRKQIQAMLRDAVGTGRRSWVDAAALLIDGAIIAADMQHTSAPAEVARKAILKLSQT